MNRNSLPIYKKSQDIHCLAQSKVKFSYENVPISMAIDIMHEYTYKKSRA